MKYTKFLSLAAALTLSAALLAGCGGSSSSASSSSSAGSSGSSSVSSAPASSEAAPAASSAAGSAQASSGAVDAAFESVLAANPISNPFEIADMNIQYDFLLDPADVVAYKGVKSNDNGDAGLVLVIQPAEGKSEAICQALESYKSDQVAYYGNYSEFAQAQANVQSAVISGRDSLVVMVIASNECPDTAALSSAVDAALVS